VAPAVQVTELSVGLAARVLALLSESRHHLSGVRFPHAPQAPLADYRAHFAAPVSFQLDCAALELRETDLSLPIRSGIPALRVLAEDYLELHYATPRTPFSVRVRGVVRRSLGTDRSTCVDVASALALHPRTLQRRLREEGTSFEQIKDEARAELARRYLEQDELPLAQVAALLDYSEQSALTRSCRRWFGRPPRTVRAERLR
jgi:AraC-like DNA-binding protein